MNLYSIKDDLADEFAPPFHAKNDSVALRAARQSFARIPSVQDFHVYCVGSFDESTGVIDALVKPALVIGNLAQPVQDMSKVFSGGKK